MTVYDEPPFRFDFTNAVASHKHDVPPHNVWKGVDFCVLEADRALWIEVKSWKFKSIADPTERKRSQMDFDIKFKKDIVTFRDDIVFKFLGTSAYLAWSGAGIPNRVYYVVLLEPTDKTSRPFLLTFQRHLRDEFKNAQALPRGKTNQLQGSRFGGIPSSVPTVSGGMVVTIADCEYPWSL